MFGPFKKEKPIQGFSGFGGGATGAAFRGPSDTGPGAPVSPKGAAGGTIITNDPSYIFHKFVVSDNGNPTGDFWCGPEWSPTTISLLTVGGGGGGGCDDYPNNRGGGGGGAGGMYYTTVPISPGTRTVTVGSGGPGALPNETKNPLGVSSPSSREYAGAPGTSSWFGESGGDTTPETLVARGGGGGGSHTQFSIIAEYMPGNEGRSMQNQPNSYWASDRQGSGGGGSNGQTGGSGQGNGSGGVGGDYGGGGGGGAGQSTDSGIGGNGLQWPQMPSPVRPVITPSQPEGYFAGGGGGRQNYAPDNQGGKGGGGAGHASGDPAGNPGAGTAGTNGLGGGGGASREVQGGKGGDGVVIVRYPA